MEGISVHGAPSEYLLQEGVLDQLESKLIERGFQKVLIVHGQKSWQATKSYFPILNRVEFEMVQYGGECSLAEIETLVERVSLHAYDALIGVGGGKVLDLTKTVSHLTRKPAVLIPTLASNCAPWTPISVIYDQMGAFVRYDLYPESASLVLVEPRIIVDSPIEMFIAGIGDTLAKWYEADVQMVGIINKPVPLQISHYAAKQCKELLLLHSEGALFAVKSGVINDDFVKVVEAIIVLGGMVGGFGDHYGRIAGAHSIHNGLTVLEETHHALHGEKVAYGILVQLVLEDRPEEIEDLLPFYRQLGLPVSLSDLGVKNISDQVIAAIATKSTNPGESIHAMPIGEITAAKVSKAISEVEKITTINI